MGVLRNENAAALLYRDTPQLEKCSKRRRLHNEDVAWFLLYDVFEERLRVHPHDSRMTRDAGILMRTRDGFVFCSICSSSRRVACSAMASIGCCTALRRGRMARDSGISPYEKNARSRGMEIRSSSNASRKNTEVSPFRGKSASTGRLPALSVLQICIAEAASSQRM